MALTLRQVCQETGKRPSKVLLYFPKEKRTGIAPTRLILKKDKNLAGNTKVTVNWQGKKVEAKILALSDNEDILAETATEWSKENLLTEEYCKINKQIDTSKRKASRKENEKVKPDQVKESPVAAQPVNRDPYTEFLEEQRKRETQWSANRKSSAAKKARILETSSESEESESAEDAKEDDKVNRLKQQLEAKDKECQLLRSQVLVQETLCKMLEKFDDSLSAMEDKMAKRLSKIERRLESLETVIKDHNDCLPSFGDFPSALCNVPVAPELQTIDIEAFESLSEEICVSTPATPVPTTPSTLSPEKA
ncbi:PREDICTED: uncharacterized protein LOC107329881 [Acropora digitifera]|uniref:uncharacterized protein LOC107329881 n=1 Tax=Acropora digitifera TaxID=70779 RepID=UPI000779F800|nr:PREDICTED: uncharacterized protein LOC107329881 [Acropora digitifera]